MARTLLSESSEKITTTTKKTKPAPSTTDAKKFDLALWASGVKPIERSISLYQRLDLLAARDEIGLALEDAKATRDEQQITDLRAEAERLTSEIQSGRISVTIQGIAPSRFQEILTEAKDNKDLDDAAKIQLWILAHQIASPEGFTFEILQELNDLIPAQVERLCSAVNQVNSAVPNVKATVPF